MGLFGAAPSSGYDCDNRVGLNGMGQCLVLGDVKAGCCDEAHVCGFCCRLVEGVCYGYAKVAESVGFETELDREGALCLRCVRWYHDVTSAARACARERVKE